MKINELLGIAKKNLIKRSMVYIVITTLLTFMFSALNLPLSIIIIENIVVLIGIDFLTINDKKIIEIYFPNLINSTKLNIPSVFDSIIDISILKNRLKQYKTDKENSIKLMFEEICDNEVIVDINDYIEINTNDKCESLNFDEDEELSDKRKKELIELYDTCKNIQSDFNRIDGNERCRK